MSPLIFSIFLVHQLFILTNPVSGILNGDEAPHEQFPSAVSIQDNHGHNLCAGSLVALRYVLTAAHCVTGPEGRVMHLPYRVFAGSSDLDSKSRKVVVSPVSRIYVPKAFKRREQLNGASYHRADLAVLKLSVPMINDVIKTAEILDSQRSPGAGTKGRVAGYGAFAARREHDPETGEQLTREIGAKNRRLRFLTHYVTTKRSCSSYYPEVEHDPDVFCAKSMPAGRLDRRGVCAGDHGAALVDHHNQIVGVWSHGPVDCNESNGHAVYTRASAYRRLIEAAEEDRHDELHVWKYDKQTRSYIELSKR